MTCRSSTWSDRSVKATVPVGNAPRKIVVQPGVARPAPRWRAWPRWPTQRQRPPRLRAARRGQSRPGQRRIANFAFSPKSLTVSAGQSVTFTNNDSVAHTTTSSAWDSGDIQPGAAYTFARTVSAGDVCLSLFDPSIHDGYPYRSVTSPQPWSPGPLVSIRSSPSWDLSSSAGTASSLPWRWSSRSGWPGTWPRAGASLQDIVYGVSRLGRGRRHRRRASVPRRGPPGLLPAQSAVDPEVWEGGIAVYGAFIGGIVGGGIAAWRDTSILAAAGHRRAVDARRPGHRSAGVSVQRRRVGRERHGLSTLSGASATRTRMTCCRRS